MDSFKSCCDNSTAIGSGAQVMTPNTIQLGNTMVSTVTTSGVVSATGFVGDGFTGDGSGLTNINPNGGINGINISGSKTAIGVWYSCKSFGCDIIQLQ